MLKNVILLFICVTTVGCQSLILPDKRAKQLNIFQERKYKRLTLINTYYGENTGFIMEISVARKGIKKEVIYHVSVAHQDETFDIFRISETELNKYN